VTLAQAPLRFLGTWKLTNASPAFPGKPWVSSLKSGIATFTQESGGIRYNFDGEDSSGKAMHESCLCPTDGCWVPTTETASGIIDNDQASIRLCEDGSLELNLQSHGNQTGVITTVISADGQTMTRSWAYQGPYDDRPPWRVHASATFARQ